MLSDYDRRVLEEQEKSISLIEDNIKRYRENQKLTMPLTKLKQFPIFRRARRNDYQRDYMKDPEVRKTQRLAYEKWYNKNRREIRRRARENYEINKKEIREKFRKRYSKDEKFRVRVINRNKKNYKKRYLENPSYFKVLSRTRRLFPIKENQKCQVCKKEGASQRHHTTNPVEYNKFKFICRECHYKIHRKF